MNPETAFLEYPKTPRLFKDCIVTEKIDGTNAQIVVYDFTECDPLPVNIPWLTTPIDGRVLAAGSRNRYLTLDKDNFGFARWVTENAEVLVRLGPGRHFGEWWGSGIQRGYGLTGGDKRFSLFNVHKWRKDPPPDCCSVVPLLTHHTFSTEIVDECLDRLRVYGSVAAPGFMNPEGIIVYHCAAGQVFKAFCNPDA